MAGIKEWTNGVQVEHEARKQLLNTAALPFIFKHLAVMPDVHYGRGSTVGSVIPTKGAIIPAAVGVDIGCGMCAVRTSLKASQLPDSLKEVRLAVEEAVPVGFASHDQESMASSTESVWRRLFMHPFNKLQDKYPEISPKNSPALQLGTLGGGNHFIELCVDENQDVWIMLHSGSRNVGNRIGTFFISKAKEAMLKQGIKLVDDDLSWLNEGTEEFQDYWEALTWAQKYAAMNRERMLVATEIALKKHLPFFTFTDRIVNCHHNYVSKENHFGENVMVTRKGAVSAQKGEMGIIPGSMGTKSYIVCGKGHEEAFCSCSHGAGRSMSRGQAKRQFTVEDHVLATAGVECRKDEGVIDETPMAYKDIDAVMEAQKDLVDVVHVLKQVMCVKG